MQDLTVIGVEDGALVVVSDGGERFRIVIDEVLQSKLRQGIASAEGAKKVSPREIQTHIRAGLSATEVAELTGASVDYVERFEGPVVAERQFIVDSALRVAVQPTQTDPLGEEPLSTFGDALEERLEALDARDRRWASWKDETGWIVKLTFTSREIDHDARWQFDPKRHVLAPLNNEATTLSRHGELSEGLIPRLRAVSNHDEAEAGRFDSGAFSPLGRADADSPAGGDTGHGADAATGDPTVQSGAGPVGSASGAPLSGAAPSGGATGPTARVGKEHSRPFDAYATKRAPDDSDTADHNQTADLLEALRRRRGEREAASFDLQDADPHDSRDTGGHGRNGGAEAPAHPAFGGPRAISGERGRRGPDAARRDPDEVDLAQVEVVDTPLEGLEPEPVTPSSSGSAAPRQGAPKRQRAAMPSWDEIVFGARSDDDPA